MARTILVALLASAAWAGGCSAVSTESETAAGADLSKVRTWAWMKDQPPGQLGSAEDRAHVTALVAEALGAGLQDRGLLHAGTGAPDVFVAFTIDVERVAKVVDYTSAVGAGRTWNGFYGSSREVRQTAYIEYDRGTLVVDMIDARTGLFLWRGTAHANVAVGMSRAEKETLAREAALKVAAEFPGAAKK